MFTEPQGEHAPEIVLAAALTRCGPAHCLPAMVGMPCSARVHTCAVDDSKHMILTHPDYCSGWNNASEKVIIAPSFFAYLQLQTLQRGVPLTHSK